MYIKIKDFVESFGLEYKRDRTGWYTIDFGINRDLMFENIPEIIDYFKNNKDYQDVIYDSLCYFDGYQGSCYNLDDAYEFVTNNNEVLINNKQIIVAFKHPEYVVDAVIEEIYSEKSDMTFIMETIYDYNKKLKSKECVGWYFGKPDLEVTEKYYGNLKSEYNVEED